MYNASRVSPSRLRIPALWFPFASRRSLSPAASSAAAPQYLGIPARYVWSTPFAPFHWRRISPCMGNSCTWQGCFYTFVSHLCPSSYAEASLLEGKYMRLLPGHRCSPMVYICLYSLCISYTEESVLSHRLTSFSQSTASYTNS